LADHALSLIEIAKGRDTTGVVANSHYWDKRLRTASDRFDHVKAYMVIAIGLVLLQRRRAPSRSRLMKRLLLTLGTLSCLGAFFSLSQVCALEQRTYGDLKVLSAYALEQSTPIDSTKEQLHREALERARRDADQEWWQVRLLDAHFADWAIRTLLRGGRLEDL